MKPVWISLLLLLTAACGNGSNGNGGDDGDAAAGGPGADDDMAIIGDDVDDDECEPVGCEAEQCGPIPDGCGQLVDCGACEGDALCGIVTPSVCTDPDELVVRLDREAACEGRECGPAGDGTGGIYECGECDEDESCGASGPARCGSSELGSDDACPAMITSCEEVGAECGVIGNGCGGTIDCDDEVGGCDAPNVCGFEEPFQCSEAPPCEPLDAEAACEGKCGIVSNGCGVEVEGGVIDCSELPGHACDDGTVCGGAGVPNECGVGTCEPLSNAAACGDRECGSTSDGCDGDATCGACADGAVCLDGFCEALCEPIPRLQACSGKDCGKVGDGCGGTHDCGDCASGGACGQVEPFSCDPVPPPLCVPFSQAEACAGKECGMVLDGCGIEPENEIDCGSCSGDQICGIEAPFTCDDPRPPDCTAATSCGELGWECGVAVDSCGNLFDCAAEGLACNAETETCIGGIEGPARCLNGTEEDGSCDVCDAIPDCSGESQRTALSGRVITPGADDADTENQIGIPNAFVYILRNDDESDLPDIPSGIPTQGGAYQTACDRCVDQDLGPVLVSTSTNPLGEFRLEGEVPVGKSFVLVVKIGKWRRAVRIDPLPPSAACTTTALPQLTTRVPRHMADGLRANIPRVAVTTGRVDAMECVLDKIGVATSEFAQPGTGGTAPQRIHMYRAANEGGARMPTGSTSAAELYGNQGRLFSYDMLIFDCEGIAVEHNADDPRVREFVNRGGRLFASHWSYTWLHDNGTTPYTAQNALITGLGPSATWGQGDEPVDTAFVSLGRPRAIDLKVQNFAAWLDREGAATVDELGRYALDIVEPRDLALRAGVASEEFVYRLPDSGIGVQTSCATCDDIVIEDNCVSSPNCTWVNGSCGPVNDCRGKDQAACDADPSCNWLGGCTFAETCSDLGAADQDACLARAPCGWNLTSVQQFAFNTPYGAPSEDICGRVAYSGFHVVADSAGFADAVFPEHCVGDLTSQEKILAYMLFDLGACVSPGGLVPPVCTPLDASACAGRCGPIADGCGGIIECSLCPDGEVCLPGGICAPPTCRPTTCEQTGAECGVVSDGCVGRLDCGACPEGEICGLVASNQCDAPCTRLDEPTACAEKCGYVSDECSDVYDCGDCPEGLVCVDNACVDRTCEPLETCPAGVECGVIGDGCDGTLDCGECDPPEVCGGAGQANVCGIPECPGLDCAEQGAQCGLLGNGCGATIDCGECPSGQVCGLGGPNRCDGCAPLACGDVDAECGLIGDGCGGTVDCGECPEGETCGADGPNRCGSGDCPARSCEDEGAECGRIGDGCGGSVDCGDCEDGQVCGIEEPFRCGDPPQCQPRTCEDANAQCGLLPDLCGDVVDCGECSRDSVCRADNTCSRGSR